MVNKPMVVVAVVVVAAGLGVAYYFHSRSAAPASAPSVVQPPPAPPPEPAIEHPVPSGAGATAQPLPSLNDSDPAVKDAISGAIGATAMQYVVPESIIRHIVVTIDNLPRQKAPAAKRPTVAVAGSFLVEGDEMHATLDPKNFARYDPMVNVVRQLDMQRVADVYFRFYPLFQSAYQDLGYPKGYFNDRLVQVIDSLLATPQPTGPIELTRPNVMYLFADPKLEALPAGQKVLLRMGPDNAAVIKAKLKELREIITASPPKH
ncbi:MAG TPA: DUF3014 domain-containing protein [Steroidobacteraceae bacterium]|nr:DUF3014 domain-containing protein [Steroidobacteraceae bacterium]